MSGSRFRLVSNFCQKLIFSAAESCSRPQASTVLINTSSAASKASRATSNPRRSACSARSAVLGPPSWASRIFEDIFDNKLFPNKITRNESNCTAAPNSSQDNPLPNQLILNPGPASDDCQTAPPAAGVKAGRRPPVGLGLDAGEDGATLPGAEAGHDQDQSSNVLTIMITKTQAACNRCRACSTSACICLIKASFPAYFT
jgi:hypothetical protein